VETTAVPEDGVVGDAALLAAVRAGDSAAMGTLYERHAGAALRVARQYVDSSSDADDVVADSFAAVLGALQRGNGPQEAFRAYLFTVVRRVAAVRRDQGRRVQPTDDVATLEAGTALAPTAAEPALEGFERGVVAQAFHSLPERWQAVLWHTEVEGKQPAEVAPLLGLSANGAAALAYRAREGLRQAYLQHHVQRPLDEGCRTVAGKLGGYVRGGLGARDTAQVESHLDGCGTCRALVLELGDVNHGMRSVIAPLVLGTAGLGAFAHLASGGTAVAAGAGASGSGSGGFGSAGSGAGGSSGAGAGSGAAATGAAGGGASAGAAGVVGGAGAAASVAGAAGTAAVGAAAASTAAGATVAGGGIAALLAAAPLGLVAAVAGGVVVAAAVTVAAVTGVLGGRHEAQDPPPAVVTQHSDDSTTGAGSGRPPAGQPTPGPSDLPLDDPAASGDDGSSDPVDPFGDGGTPGTRPAPVVPAPAVPVEPADVGAEPVGSQDPGTTPTDPDPTDPGEPTDPGTDPGEPTDPGDPGDDPVVLEVRAPDDGSVLELEPGQPGQDLAFDVVNAGRGTVSDLTADVVLPEGVTLDGIATSTFASVGRFAAPAASWICSEGGRPDTAHCELTQLGPGETARLRLRVAVAPVLDGADGNVEVRVSGPAVRDDEPRSIPVRIKPVPAQLALGLGGDVGADGTLPLVIDRQATVDVDVTNEGGSVRASVRLTVVPPPGVSVTARDGDGWRCDPTDEGLLCRRDGLPHGASSVPVVVTASDEAADGAALSTVLTVGNGHTTLTASAPVTVRRPARLVLSSTAPQPLVVPHGRAVDVTVRNEGGSAAHDVTVVFQLTAGWLDDLGLDGDDADPVVGHAELAVPDDPAGAECSTDGRTVRCVVAEIPAGGDVTLRPQLMTGPWLGGGALRVSVEVDDAVVGPELNLGNVYVLADVLG